MKIALAILGIIFGILLAWYLIFYIGWAKNYSEGQRTGDVFKFSKKGLIWKSWEGELYLGGVRTTGGDSPRLELEKFYFSIPSSQEQEKSALIEKLNACSEKRLNCTIIYKQWFKKPIYQDSSSTVVEVKLLK